MSAAQFNSVDRLAVLVCKRTFFLCVWLLCQAVVALDSATAQVPVADQSTCFIPLATEATTGKLPANALFPDQAMGAASSLAWSAYMRLWRAHHDEPSDTSIRRYLGLPIKGTVEAKSKRGRSAPRWMGWAAGSYQQIDTPHFTVFTHADEPAAVAVAEDLEHCYWIWTQMFFPLWEASGQVTATLKSLGDQDVSEFLHANPSSRISIRRKLRVVLFRDAAEYQQTLGRDIPGIERSTGFYNDDKRTIFLYVSADDDVETRRHELVHQLFREATRSTLGNRKPAERSEFWIIEGIAGYFESIHIGDHYATVGGWHAPRLQFARYRMLQNGDVMPINELRADGRIAAQKRQDIARWYAHSIAQTHHLMDSGDPKKRIGVYQILANQYGVKSSISGGAIIGDVQRQLHDFLVVSDADLKANPCDHPPKKLCLTGCEVSSGGLRNIPPSDNIQWLDLTRLPIDNEAVTRIAPNPIFLSQLTLEGTRVDTGLGGWLSKAINLRELDLSLTPMDDTVLTAVSGANDLQVLWMTGTKVSDRSIDTIASFGKLESVDVQRTQVTDQGIARLKKLRPKLNINPLQLRTK